MHFLFHSVLAVISKDCTFAPLPAEVLTAAGEGLYAGATDLLESLEQRDNERAQRTREQFDAFMSKHSVQRGDASQAPEKPVAAWLEEVMPGDEVVGNRGRLFDLIVVGRPVVVPPRRPGVGLSQLSSKVGG